MSCSESCPPSCTSHHRTPPHAGHAQATVYAIFSPTPTICSLHLHLHLYTNTHTLTHTHMHQHAHTHQHTHTHIHTYTHTHTHTHTNKQTHTHTYKHMHHKIKQPRHPRHPEQKAARRCRALYQHSPAVGTTTTRACSEAPQSLEQSLWGDQCRRPRGPSCLQEIAPATLATAPPLPPTESKSL